MVEARFVCNFVGPVVKNENTGVEGRSITLYADPDDEIFKVYTPSASLSMLIIGSASEQFEVGNKYRVLFEEL